MIRERYRYPDEENDTMENALTLTKSPHADSLAVATRQAHKFISQAKARNTVRAYRSDWSHFETWCHQHGVASLPADVETVASYLSDLAATSRVSTLQRRVAAISVAHKMAGHGSPTSSAAVRALLAGIRRSLGTKPGAKKPALTDDIRAMLDCLPDSLLGARDRALLLLGFAGAFRRSELVGLDVQDLEFTDDGLVITLRRSKTDQEGETRKVGIPFGSGPTTCPVRALRSWLDQTAINEGPVFRSVTRHGKLQPGRLTAQSVALVIKRYAQLIGKDPAVFAGHSLRAGHATQAAANGASERSIMNQTGHKSLKMVRRYIREGSLFRENAAARLGL